MGKVETEQEWQEHMSEEILGILRSELYMDFRYMDMALSALSWCPKNGIDTLGTDGNVLFYSPEQLIRVYPKNPVFLNRCYLHSVLHCVFFHLWIQGNRQDDEWDLACDIMVEYVIDHLEKNSTKRILGWMRRDIYKRLDDTKKKLSAASIYQEMKGWREEDFDVLRKEFYTDTHAFWPRSKQESPMPLPSQKKWDKLSRQTQMQMEQRGSEDAQGQQIVLDQISVKGNRYCYSEFLRRFALLREEMQCDPEEFDMNYYTFGLRLYGNMPLVEPLESKEVLKIQTFVVVIDTSYSTSGALVRNFIRQTAKILLGSGQISDSCRIHIIQCDDKVQKDDIITNIEELERLIQNFEIVGGGGTDFRPAFRYVNALIEQKQLKDLRGLIYFTDGKGIYPGKRPDYQTAFVFVGEYDEAVVPPWAMQYTCSHTELKID